MNAPSQLINRRVKATRQHRASFAKVGADQPLRPAIEETDCAPVRSRLAAIIISALFLFSFPGLTGCLSRPALNQQTFTFNPPAISATNAVAGGRVLGIRNLRIAPPFAGRSLVYRTGEYSYTRDPYAEFLEPPADEITDLARGLLRGQGNFSAVAEAGSSLQPDTLAEISVIQFFGDFQRPEHPAAILTMRFIFFDAPKGVPGKIILQQEYSRNIPLSAPTAAALVAGWNQALTGILAEVSSDFRDHATVNPR